MKNKKTLPEYRQIKKISPQTLTHLGTQFRHQNRGIQAGRVKVV